MNIHRADAHTVVLSEIEPFAAELLRALLASTDPTGSEAARDRLFSSPSGGADPTMDEDWRSFVQPDLVDTFAAHRSVVEEDLAQLGAGDSPELLTLVLPFDHLDHWLSALNQARLVLSSRYDIGEHEMDDLPPPLESERGLAVLRIYFYGMLMVHFLDELRR